MNGGRRELRRNPRRWTRRNAEILLHADGNRLPCAVLDLSDGGARLGVSAVAANLPRHFTLVLFKDGSLQRDCEIVWNDHRCVGVKFVSDWYGALRPDQSIAISFPGAEPGPQSPA